MTPKEAVDLAERALRRGMCSPKKIAHEGCATCEASEAAIAELRRGVEPKGIVHLCESEHVHLIAEAPTGFWYEAQCGGILCSHFGIEGAVVAVANDTGLGDAMCDLVGYCGAQQWTPELVSRANAALAALAWSTFTEIRGLRLDEERLGDSIEGWWRVRFELTYPLDGQPTTSHRGVVCGPNCD